MYIEFFHVYKLLEYANENFFTTQYGTEWYKRYVLSNVSKLAWKF